MISKNRIIIYSLVVALVLLFSACTSGADTAQIDGDAQMPEMDGETLPEGVEMPENAPAGEFPAGEMPEGDAPADGVPPADEAAVSETAVAQVIHTVDFDESLPASMGDLPSIDVSQLNINGVLIINNKTFIQSHEDLSAVEDDQSVAIVTGEGNLTVADAEVVTEGNTSSVDKSRLYGQNAAILAEEDSILKVLECDVKTTGSGANGVFATDELTNTTVADSTLESSGDNACAVLAVKNAVISLTDTDMSTSGENSAAAATGRLGGVITIEGGNLTASGSNSPAIQSTGAISVSNAVLAVSGAEAAVVEGAGSITLTDTDLSSSKDNFRGVTLYQSVSSDNEDIEGTFSMTGGSLAYTGKEGPLFYVTNTTGNILLSDVEVSVASGVLVSAVWIESGSVSASAVISADGQALEGDLIADEASSITFSLQNGSSYSGAIDAADIAKATRLTLDASSTWNVTADSYLTKLTNEEGISEDSTISNIIGNGHTVYYNANANIYLKGSIYPLSGGGYLKPLN